MVTTKIAYEDAYARKFDRYLSNLTIKMGKNSGWIWDFI